MLFRELILLAVAGICLANRYEGCPRIITREEWGAQRPANYQIPLGRPAPFTIIHHTASWPCYNTRECIIIVRAIQSYHIEALNWSDIGYSYLIGGDGNVYEGRGCTKVAFLAPGWDYKSLAVAFIGNFDGDREPSEKMLETARKLILCGRAHGSLTDTSHVLGARQVSATQSPGEKLYAQIKTWPEWLPLHESRKHSQHY